MLEPLDNVKILNQCWVVFIIIINLVFLKFLVAFTMIVNHYN